MSGSKSSLSEKARPFSFTGSGPLLHFASFLGIHTLLMIDGRALPGNAIWLTMTSAVGYEDFVRRSSENERPFFSFIWENWDAREGKSVL